MKIRSFFVLRNEGGNEVWNNPHKKRRKWESTFAVDAKKFVYIMYKNNAMKVRGRDTYSFLIELQSVFLLFLISRMASIIKIELWGG